MTERKTKSEMIPISERYQGRWLIRRDMDRVLMIDRQSFASPWSEEDFLVALKQRDTIGMVVQEQNETLDGIVGFAVYKLKKHSFEMIRFAVEPWTRREGAGRFIIDRMIQKLSGTNRNEITAEVEERNLTCQLFLQEMGFKAVDSISVFGGDLYVMKYSKE